MSVISFGFKKAPTPKGFSALKAAATRRLHVSELTKAAKELIKPQNKGLLHSKLGVKPGSKIPESKLLKAKHSSSSAERKEANFAINAKKWNHKKEALLVKLEDEGEKRPHVKAMADKINSEEAEQVKKVRRAGLKGTVVGGLLAGTASAVASHHVPSALAVGAMGAYLGRAIARDHRMRSLDENNYQRMVHAMSEDAPHTKKAAALAAYVSLGLDFDKAASLLRDALVDEASTVPGDIVGGGAGVLLAKHLTPKTATKEQVHRNELIAGAVGAKTGSVGGLMIRGMFRGAKDMSKAASLASAAKNAARFTGENLLLSGAGGVIGQEIANDTASDEVLADPKKSARRSALGALAGTAGTGMVVSFAHELRKAR